MKIRFTLIFFFLWSAIAQGQWCAPGMTPGSGNGITNVTFNTIARASGVDEGYINTGMTTNVLAGSSYTLSVTFLGGNAPNVWIDWNQDFDFLDAGENITLLSWYPTFNATKVITFTVPLTATIGVTRMRIWAKAFGTGPVPNACVAASAGGDIEDYSINVLPGTMIYDNSTTTQALPCFEAFPGESNRWVIGISINTQGTLTPLAVTAMNFNTAGSTNPVDILSAKVYYTADSNLYRPINLLGTTASPSGAFSITGSQPMQEGVNYFWLVYDLAPGATPGNLLDAECNSVTCGGVFVPTVQTPPGFLIIQPTPAFTGAGPALDYSGTDFWFNLPVDFGCHKSIYITGDVNTAGTVSIPGLGFSQAFCFTGPGGVEVFLPNGYAFSTINTVVNFGIHVVADNKILVSSAVGGLFVSDNLSFMPTASLGTEYFVNVNQSNNVQDVYLTATQNGTTVTITNTGALQGGIAPGTTTVINMNQGESYHIQGLNIPLNSDISGTHIVSTSPVSVTVGSITRIPIDVNYNDYEAEQMTPVVNWGKDFLIAPVFIGADYGFYVQLVSALAGNEISINGVPDRTLCAGEIWRQFFMAPVFIQTSLPAYAIFATTGEGIPASNTDPSFANAQPLSFYQTQFNNIGYGGLTLSCGAPSLQAYRDSVLVIAPTVALATTTLGGLPVPVASFAPIGVTGFSFANLKEPLGYYTLTSTAPVMAYQNGPPAFPGQGQLLRNMGTVLNPPNSNVCPVLGINSIILKGKQKYGAFELQWNAFPYNFTFFYPEYKANIHSPWIRLSESGNYLAFTVKNTAQFQDGTLFRVQGMNENGQWTISNAVRFNANENIADPSVFPNPAIAGEELHFTADDQFDQVTILNMEGREVAAFPLINGMATLNHLHLKTGIYAVRFSGVGGEAHLQLVIQR